MSEMSNTEEREDTACIEITCSVKGYQECNFTVDVVIEIAFYLFCFVLFEHWHSCSMMFSSWLFNKSWQWLYSTCFTQFEASRDNCIGLGRFCSIIWFDWFAKSNSQQNRCSILIAEPNRTIGVRLGDWVRLVFCSVLFDWIDRDYGKLMPSRLVQFDRLSHWALLQALHILVTGQYL